jgi:WD40 repeat protein
LYLVEVERLASWEGADNIVTLWDVSNPIAIFQLGILEGHRGFVTSVAFSSDGRRLVSGSLEHTIALWDISDPTAIFQFCILDGQYSAVTSVTFSPNGRW